MQREYSSERGVILLTVIAAVMLMSILVMGMLSRNISQAVISERERKHLQAELIAKKALWWAREIYIGGSTSLTDFTEYVDGTTYSVQYTQVDGGGPGATRAFTMNVSY